MFQKGDIALKKVSDLYIYPNDLKVAEAARGSSRRVAEAAAGKFNQI